MTALDLHNCSKTFSGQVVLDRVDLTAGEGEIHALVGQNGSGKSTLIKILAGYHAPDDGATAEVNGTRLTLGSATDAHARGLRFVHQDLGLVGDLSAVENIMMGRRYPTSRIGRVRWTEARRITGRVLERVGLDIDVRSPVNQLGFADRSRLAIARALPDQEDERIVLVLDEPTAALPSEDVDRLFATMRRLQNDGHAVILVSHHLDEVLDIADMITVLRDGKRITTTATADIDQHSLTRLVVGAELDLTSTRQPEARAAYRPVLTVSRLNGASVADVSFTVGQGEIVGIAGLSGSGRETVASLINGHSPHDGEVSVSGKRVRTGSPSAALASGIASVPGERARFGVCPTLSVRENLTLGSLGTHTRFGRISRAREKREVASWVADLGIVTRNADAPITSLSGGNQQKVLIARALRLNPSVLVLDDPTAGIDVGARDQVHRIVESRVSGDMAVVLVSTDSEELARLCDRVLVLHRGRIGAELLRGSTLDAAAIDHAQVTVNAG